MADGYQAQTYPDSQNLFTLGDAAIYPTGSWEIFTFSQNADFEFSAFAPPVRDGESNCFIDDHTDIGIGLNSKAKNPAEAKVFLEWLTGAEFAEIFANEVPGLYFWLGVNAENVTSVPGNHTPYFVVHDSALDTGVKSFVNLVSDYSADHSNN